MMMRVLFAIGEAAPFAKTGGLGDVGGSLPAAINQYQGEVRVILPRFSTIPEHLSRQIKHITGFRIDLGWRRQYCGLGEMEYRGVHYYFIDNEYYFKRDRLYGYEDDGERYAFFCRGVLESLTYLEGFRPELLHCNDWHTALIPVMLEEFYHGDPFYYGMKTLLTVHNLKHQGILPVHALGDLLGLVHKERARRSLEVDGTINFLKGGLLYADAITTVSPTYAGEIQNPFYGEGLDEVLKQRRDQLFGILNGIDYEEYNPQTDPRLFANYGSLEDKIGNKTGLQKHLNLPDNKEIPLMALVSRLVPQKGLDLLAHILEELLQEELQLVVLGTGEERYENMFRHFAARYPEKLAAAIKFDDDLAHKIYAGADLLLMPSLFEPCGLSQMIAMRYGTIPLVRETGGLKDTVIPYNKYTGEGNGFSFANYNAHELLFTAKEAIRVYREHPEAWQGLMKQAYETDFSWEQPARRYRTLYEQLIEGDSTGVKEGRDIVGF